MQTKPYDFNLDTKNKGFIPKMEFVQGDYKTNILNVTLTSDGTPIDLTGLTVIAAFSKPDGKKVIDSSIENDTLKIITPLDGLIQITLRTQAISAVGEVLTTISLNSVDGKKLTSMEFKFKVRESFETDEIIQSINEMPILSKLINDTTTLKNNMESAEVIRVDSETDRAISEIVRNTTEDNRVSSEDIRNTSETNRIDSETIRCSNENIRIVNEDTRKTNENIRQTAETIRQGTISQFQNWYNTSSLTGKLPFIIDGGDFGDTTLGGVYNGGDF